jgi:hypothetical protein
MAVNMAMGTWTSPAVRGPDDVVDDGLDKRFVLKYLDEVPETYERRGRQAVPALQAHEHKIYHGHYEKANKQKQRRNQKQGHADLIVSCHPHNNPFLLYIVIFFRSVMTLAPKSCVFE